MFSCLLACTAQHKMMQMQNREYLKITQLLSVVEHWQYSLLYLTHRMIIDVKHHHCLSLFQLVVVFLHQIDTSQGTILPELGSSIVKNV